MSAPTTTEGPAFTAPLADLQTAIAALAVVPIVRSQPPVLGSIDGDRVAIGLTSSSKPAVLAADVPSLRDAAAFRHLVMPHWQPS